MAKLSLPQASPNYPGRIDWFRVIMMLSIVALSILFWVGVCLALIILASKP